MAASSENHPNRSKVPITTVNHETAIGVRILYSLFYKYINFFDINSPSMGNGGKIGDAILSDFPKDWQLSVCMDWSDVFWDAMKEKYVVLNWI